MENLGLEALIKRVEKLEQAVFGKTGENRKPQAAPKGTPDIDFQLNERAYVKRYLAGKGGPRKFTLLIAYLTKGQIGVNVKLGEIERLWGKMSAKPLLGKFNRFYSNAAKTNGWVDSKEHAAYFLTKEWKNAI
jgi:hypothetical protein